MYFKESRNQIGIEGFFLPFGGRLQKDNRWIRLTERMPWEEIKTIYLKTMNQETGRRAYPARLAFDACVRERKLIGRKNGRGNPRKPIYAIFSGAAGVSCRAIV